MLRGPREPGQRVPRAHSGEIAMRKEGDDIR